MSRYIADIHLGMGAQALAVLAMLSRCDCDGLAEYDKEWKEYKIEIRTWAWYNGRECGACLEVRPFLSSERALLITFGEHRNTDSIFVDSWEVDEFFLNPPTVANFTDAAYKKRTCVPYGNVGDAVAVIRAKITEFMDKCSRPAPTRVLPDLGEGEDEPVATPEAFVVMSTMHSGGGTSLQGEFPASFSELLARFGMPAYLATKRDPNSDGKTSTEWCFQGADGEPVTLYDYKETSLYDRGNPTPKAFRARPSYAWHVGAKSKATAAAFMTWLRVQLGRSS